MSVTRNPFIASTSVRRPNDYATVLSRPRLIIRLEYYQLVHKFFYNFYNLFTEN